MITGLNKRISPQSIIELAVSSFLNELSMEEMIEVETRRAMEPEFDELLNVLERVWRDAENTKSKVNSKR